MTKRDLAAWIVEALQANGGSTGLVGVCRHVWEHHETDLRDSGDLFFTWQYDIRWAATDLRHGGVLKAAALSPVGIWELA
jgi:hypothetical protein